MSKSSATSGFLWKIFEQFGIIGVQFILQIVLARILTPTDYGVIAIIAIFISFATIFVQCGLSTALVQKKEIDNIEVSSIFNFSLIIGLVLYGLLYIIAPYIGQFFQMPELPSLLRVMLLTIFPGLYNAIQTALLRRELHFKVIFFSSVISVILSGSIGIMLAYSGYQAWALVWQTISYQVFTCITLFIGVKWVPIPVLKFKRIKPLVNYGWKILITHLIDDICLNIRSFVIGKRYNGESLAFFNRGKSFPDLLVRSFNGALQSVLLPVLSREQDNTNKLRDLVRRTISISTFVVFPLLSIMAFSGSTFIPLLLTDKWSSAVFYLQVFCIYFMSWPITTSNIEALYAKGLSGLVLKLETIRKITDIIVLCISLFWGMTGIAWGVAIVSVSSIPLYLFPAKKELDYPITEQLHDIMPSLLLALSAGIAVGIFGLLHIPLFIKLICQFAIGIAIYLFGCVLFRLKAYESFKFYAISIIKNKLNAI